MLITIKVSNFWMLEEILGQLIFDEDKIPYLMDYSRTGWVEIEVELKGEYKWRRREIEDFEVLFDDIDIGGIIDSHNPQIYHNLEAKYITYKLDCSWYDKRQQYNMIGF